MKAFTNKKRNGLFLSVFAVMCIAAIFSLALTGCGEKDDDDTPKQNFVTITSRPPDGITGLVVCTTGVTRAEVEAMTGGNMEKYVAGQRGTSELAKTAIPLTSNSKLWGEAGTFDVVIQESSVAGTTLKVKRNVSFPAGGTVTIAYSEFGSF